MRQLTNQSLCRASRERGARHTYLLTLLTVCLIGIVGCATPPVPKSKSAPVLAAETIGQLPVLSYHCTDATLQAELARMLSQRWTEVPTAEEADLLLRAGYSLDLERSRHGIMWANLLTVPIGYFFFYYTVYPSGSLTCEVDDRRDATSWTTTVEAEMPQQRHPGYLPPPPTAEEARRHLFYTPLQEKLRRLLAQEAVMHLVDYYLP